MALEESIAEAIDQAINTPDQNTAASDQQLAAFLYGVIEAQITRADTKAGLVVAADSVFATALFLSSRGTLLHLFSSTALLSLRVFALITILVFGALLASTLFALAATRPTLKVRNDEGTLFFFSRIARLDHSTYLDHFAAQDSSELRRALLTEVHNTAQIAMRKFVRVRYSIDFLIIAVVLWAVLQLLFGLLP